MDPNLATAVCFCCHHVSAGAPLDLAATRCPRCGHPLIASLGEGVTKARAFLRLFRLVRPSRALGNDALPGVPRAR